MFLYLISMVLPGNNGPLLAVIRQTQKQRVNMLSGSVAFYMMSAPWSRDPEGPTAGGPPRPYLIGPVLLIR